MGGQWNIHHKLSFLHFFFFHFQHHRLHAKYVASILRDATKELKKLPNLNQATTAISKQITICGDLHGKLDDLLVIFHKVRKGFRKSADENKSNGYLWYFSSTCLVLPLINRGRVLGVLIWTCYIYGTEKHGKLVWKEGKRTSSTVCLLYLSH